uniref:Uncharacterized protein n=1 Tax=Strombidium rassoulzadegani TaxID=1082188 RepID=A0A7S3CL69_9SPIT|mmetsp:Transcript_12320/g.20711  ORF Transcript_12320/g.20711 Transcript_12320/m.20711 type:complete len:106 (+) Transcript_12320:219-536(+)
MQDNDQPKISCSDKDFKPAFFDILDQATAILFEAEALILGVERQFSEEQVSKVKEEKYDELAEEFLDAVFEYDSSLERKEWEKTVVKKQGFIFHPEKIREKLGLK